MLAAVYTQALFVVTDVAYLRGAGVILAFVRTFLARKRFVTFRMGLIAFPAHGSNKVWRPAPGRGHGGEHPGAAGGRRGRRGLSRGAARAARHGGCRL